MWALSWLPTLMPTWPCFSKAVSHPRASANPFSSPALPHSATAAPTGLILCKAGTPSPLPPHGKINFLERRRSGLPPSAKPSALAPGHYNQLWGSILTTNSVAPGFLCAHCLPSRHPQTTGTNPKTSFFNFPPRHIINKLLQLQTERRKSSNFEALGISKSRAKIQNKCSFMWRPPLFFPFCSFVKPGDPFRDNRSCLAAPH